MVGAGWGDGSSAALPNMWSATLPVQSCSSIRERQPRAELVARPVEWLRACGAESRPLAPCAGVSRTRLTWHWGTCSSSARRRLAMFKRIVVPLDGSRFAEAALAPARELARAAGASILLVRAVPPHSLPDILPGFFTDTIGGDGHQADVERANDADAYLHTMTDQLRRAGYDADMALAIAAPGAGIVEAAALDHADLIIMASHLRWKVPAATGASATLDVMVRSRVPLLAWRVNDSAEPEGGLDGDERLSVLARAESPLVVPLDG